MSVVTVAGGSTKDWQTLQVSPKVRLSVVCDATDPTALPCRSTGYQPITFSIKPHARIIWDVAFSPLFPTATASEDMLFVTGSRDKTAKVWRRPDANKSDVWENVKVLKFDEGVTSVDFYSGVSESRCGFSSCPPSLSDRDVPDAKRSSSFCRLVLAVGLESGHIHLFTAPVSDASDWTPVLTLEPA